MASPAGFPRSAMPTLRGNRNDLIALRLSNLLVFEPGKLVVCQGVAS